MPPHKKRKKNFPSKIPKEKECITFQASWNHANINTFVWNLVLMSHILQADTQTTCKSSRTQVICGPFGWSCECCSVSKSPIVMSPWTASVNPLKTFYKIYIKYNLWKYKRNNSIYGKSHKNGKTWCAYSLLMTTIFFYLQNNS